MHEPLPYSMFSRRFARQLNAMRHWTVTTITCMPIYSYLYKRMCTVVIANVACNMVPMKIKTHTKL